MRGGAGNDTYFVDNAGDKAIEKAREGPTLCSRGLTSLCREPGEPGPAQRQPEGYGNGRANALRQHRRQPARRRGRRRHHARRLGDDAYFVDNAGDTVTDVGEGTDQVFVAVNYTLWADVDALVLTGAAI